MPIHLGAAVPSVCVIFVLVMLPVAHLAFAFLMTQRLMRSKVLLLEINVTELQCSNCNLFLGLTSHLNSVSALPCKTKLLRETSIPKCKVNKFTFLY